VYGLLIVFVSLLGFISMVWLKDQLGNGAPHWLARDQQEAAQHREQEVLDVANEQADQDQNQVRHSTVYWWSLTRPLCFTIGGVHETRSCEH